jgi:hypothetical protein
MLHGAEMQSKKTVERAYIWDYIFEPWIELHKLVEPITHGCARILFAVVENGVLKVDTSFNYIGGQPCQFWPCIALELGEERAWLSDAVVDCKNSNTKGGRQNLGRGRKNGERRRRSRIIQLKVR